MKLKFFLFFLFIYSGNAIAAADGWTNALARGSVACGTDLIAKTYAYKDNNGGWHGIDADFCKLFSFALFGNENNIKMVHVPAVDAANALKSGKIDVMLSQAPAQAGMEISGSTIPVDILYYDKQMFLGTTIENATSMDDYQGQKICAASNSEEIDYLHDFNQRYSLDLKLLKFPSFEKAKEAFLLNRCQLISGSEIQLKSILMMPGSDKRPIALLPEVIAVKPVFAQVSPGNDFLRRQVKWIINAPRLAEHLKMTSKNIVTFSGTSDSSTRNLLGDNPALWKKFELVPDGVKRALEKLGNYGEIYERNLGSDSPLKIKREQNQLIENGGLLNYQLFL